MRTITAITTTVVALLTGSVVASPATASTASTATTTTTTSTTTEERSVRFTAAGDYSSSYGARKVLEGIGAADPDVHFALGDFSYGVTGEEQAWCDLVTSRVGTDLPFELLAGNHESNGRNGHIDSFAGCLPNRLPGLVGSYGREYYVDVPAEDPLVRYVMISPGMPFDDGVWTYPAGSARYEWTADAIDGARDAEIPWVVVGMHNPCLTIGRYPCGAGEDMMNLLVDKKVDLVLGGHEHIYQRSQQLATGTNCSRLSAGTVNEACIADRDPDVTAGAGTVFTTIGTGGVEFRDINLADSEIGYFAAWSGRNVNPTFGFLDMTATEDALTGAFTRTSGGTFTDRFSVTREKPNSPPVAGYTSSCPLLSCTFYASPSTDTDGYIARYEWEFGDGSTAVGRNVAHRYTAGSHEVTLTVTDNEGAVASNTRRITAPTSWLTPVAADDFSRELTGTWGAAATGGRWTSGSSASYFATSNGSGRLIVPASRGPEVRLADASTASLAVSTSLTFDELDPGSRLYSSISPRTVPGVGAYGAKVRVTPEEGASVQLVRTDPSGAQSTLGAAIPLGPTRYEVGTELQLRVDAVGAHPTVLRAKLWPSGSVEPSWQTTVTDATPGLQVSGFPTVNAYLSAGATGGPKQVGFGDFIARRP
ncbi:PKD domain-containing protein [Planctomonas psychrotolerans]|uniref:PKD domain-containing protein n=1 Tax=Planctomonas psychrotolerans TaxID=2528712 RepID=UPI001D0D477A|nr:PKD domain-containing protein [Planctomonas psychrotolerans]